MESECTLRKHILCAIRVPNIIKFSRHLTKLWQKQFCTVFLRHGVQWVTTRLFIKQLWRKIISTFYCYRSSHIIKIGLRSKNIAQTRRRDLKTHCKLFCMCLCILLFLRFLLFVFLSFMVELIDWLIDWSVHLQSVTGFGWRKVETLRRRWICGFGSRSTAMTSRPDVISDVTSWRHTRRLNEFGANQLWRLPRDPASSGCECRHELPRPSATGWLEAWLDQPGNGWNGPASRCDTRQLLLRAVDVCTRALE